MTLLEAIGAAAGLLCVWLYVRQSIWSWPVGILQVCIFAWIFFHAKLYSDMVLQFVYIGLQFYGWWFWLCKRSTQHAAPITTLSMWSWATSIAVAVAGTLLLGTTMHRYTDASLPYWDAFTTVTSLVAQLLISRKILENWIFWIVVDVVSIGIYLFKDLYITAGLYSVFLVLACLGWFQWRRSVATVRLQPALV